MTTQSVSLPHNIPRARLHSYAFREEPAITGLVRLFTPIPRSPERNDTQYRFGPPPPFRRASTCPGIDRPVSGLDSVISGAFTPRPRPSEDGYGLVAFALATWRKPVNHTTKTNSLPRVSKRTSRHCKRTVVLIDHSIFLPIRTFRAVTDYTQLVSGSFYLAFAILFSVLSSYLFAIGLC